MNRKSFFIIAISAVTFFSWGKTVTRKNTTDRPRRVSPKRGSGLNAYKLGSSLRSFFDIQPMRPMNKSHRGWGEYKCKSYGPKQNLKIGDFTIPNDNVFLIFYKDRLMRIRVINPFSGRTGRNLTFFTSMLAALTQKYGSAKSSVPIYSKYDGKYEWKKRECQDPS